VVPKWSPDSEEAPTSQIDRRNGKYRARYRDPLGRRRSKRLLRKADAERYLREMQLEVDRGSWLGIGLRQIAELKIVNAVTSTTSPITSGTCTRRGAS
jgi:hypothetical protein